MKDTGTLLSQTADFLFHAAQHLERREFSSLAKDILKQFVQIISQLEALQNNNELKEKCKLSWDKRRELICHACLTIFDPFNVKILKNQPISCLNIGNKVYDLTSKKLKLETAPFLSFVSRKNAKRMKKHNLSP
jgi:hypothetical protein